MNFSSFELVPKVFPTGKIVKTALLILTLAFFACGNPSPNNLRIDKPQAEKQVVVEQDTAKAPKAAVLTQPQLTKFFIKDETKYSQAFLEEFKRRHRIYESVSLLDDTLIVNNDRAGYIIIPTDLPLNQEVTYTKTVKSKTQVLTVKRINYSTLEYRYDEAHKGQKKKEMQGTADLEPVFYMGAEGAFEDENEHIFGMNEYIDFSEKGCRTYLYIGVGSIQKSQFTYHCETGGDTLHTGLMTRTK